MSNINHTEDPVRNINRITEIARLKLHEEQVDEILNEYVQKAAEEFSLPIGLVSIVMDDAQKFAASHGVGDWIKSANGTPVEWSFCANSVKTKEPFVVEDATTHQAVKDNPLVQIDGIRCYAGAPLTTSNGYVVGNFCVIGDQSRSFSEQEVERLKEYASKVMARIEERLG